jgi:hypothetical protein
MMNRRRTFAVAASLAVLAVGAIGTSSAGAGQPGGGSFVCDGFTGCYIDGALTSSCSGSLQTGPFQCSVTIPARFVDRVVVQPESVCDVHLTPLGQPIVQQYYSEHGLIQMIPNGSTTTLVARCPGGGAS